MSLGTVWSPFLTRHRIDHADRLDAYEKRREAMPPGYGEVDPSAVTTLQFGIVYEQAVLAWFDQLSDAMPAPTGDRR